MNKIKHKILNIFPKIVNKKSSAFTIIELIVWITISIILMISVSVFVSSWLKNIYVQQKVLEDNYETSFVFDDLKEIINNTQTWTFINCPIGTLCSSSSSTWIIFKLEKSLSNWGFVYIWDKQLDNFYCQSWSESISTKHLIIKKFIPFESIWADIFSGSSYLSWFYKANYLSWVLSESWANFAWNYFSPSDIVFWLNNDMYVSDTKSHTILKFNKTNTSIPWVIVVWKWIFWTEFTNWNIATWAYLNNPTWLAFWEWKLFLSDTLNNRILYLSWSYIYNLLDSYDWLIEPTWLFYSDERKSLFISNSWKWEILEYSSSWITSIPELNLNFSSNSNISADNFDIEFFTWWISLASPTSTWSFTFSWFSQSYDNLTLSSSKFKYSFLDNVWASILQTFTWGENYKINIRDIDFTTTTTTWSVYVKLSLFSWSVLKYNDYFPYFVRWDNSILTKWDNVLKTINGWLKYPTWIYFDWTNIMVNDFLTREKLTVSVTWSLINTWNLSKFDLSIFNYNEKFDEVLNTPLKSFVYDYSSNLLTIILKYYKSYNCYNFDEKVDRAFVLKKSF